MKKLMIAAAAVAMVSGAFADGYDFVATVKTTKGKMGSDYLQDVKLGAKDAQGSEFWYEDTTGAFDTVTNILGGVAWHKVGGSTVPMLPTTKTPVGTVSTKSANGELLAVPATVYADFDTMTNLVANLRYLSSIYDEKSAGQWCCYVKVKVLGDCYRVAGSEKIQDVLWQESCCDANYTLTTNSFGSTLTGATIGFNTNGVASAVLDYTNAAVVVENPIFQWFGNQSLDKCNKCEIYAYALFPEDRDFQGWIAGQGAYDWRNNRVTSINGNIVGTMAAPGCPNCCTKPQPSVAYDCLNLDYAAQLPRTAAFGTFRLKYNKNR